MADTERFLNIFRHMILMRRFEEAVYDLHQQKYFEGHYHLYIGQEATGAAVMASLVSQDRIFSTHRNHGHLVARGVDPKNVLAEILNRTDGTNGGRGGTFHIADASVGMPHTSALVGGAVPLAAGAGFAAKLKRTGGIGVSIFGDGCFEEGVVFETLNLALMWELPVIFVCENNTPGALLKSAGGNNTSNLPKGRVIQVPESLGMECHEVDGGDAAAVDVLFAECAARIRQTSQPIFIEALTERWPGNYFSFPSMVTGTTKISMAWDGGSINTEYENWFRVHDPVLRFARELIVSGVATVGDITAIDMEATEIVTEASGFALNSPIPGSDSVFDHVIAEGN